MLFLEATPCLTGRICHALPEQLYGLHSVGREFLLPIVVCVNHESFTMIIRIAKCYTIDDW
jgi:hypothetical protein